MTVDNPRGREIPRPLPEGIPLPSVASSLAPNGGGGGGALLGYLGGPGGIGGPGT